MDEEASGREREQEKNITMEDLYKALGLDFWTANDPERRDEGREGELQGSDEDAEDHLIEFASRLETGTRPSKMEVYHRQPFNGDLTIRFHINRFEQGY